MATEPGTRRVKPVELPLPGAAYRTVNPLVGYE